MNVRFLIIYLSFGLFWGCNKFDPPETIPAYIKIDSIEIETTSAQGTNDNSGIKDAWIYVNEELIGVFELPLNIPVLKEGLCNVKIYAGVKRNGFAEDGEKYLFLNPYEVDANLVAGEILSLNPKVTYTSNANIWIENFEGPGIKLSKTSTADVDFSLTTNTDEVFEGSSSCKVEFISGNLLFEMQSDEVAFDNFNLGSNIYLEMNYKSNYHMIVGIFSRKTGELVDTQTPYLTLFSTEDDNDVAQWKKIYVDLTEVIRPVTPTEDLDIFIGIQYDASQSATLPIMYLDNIKVIYL
ncbi:MAG: hypothetical protein ACLGGV_09885 [Bacteroidia bacterium]